MFDLTKFIILFLCCLSGFMIVSYEGVAERRGWPIGEKFALSNPSWVGILGIFNLIGSIVLSFILNPWWSALVVFSLGFLGNLIMTSIFKKNTQILALVLSIITYILVLIYVF